jgi:hypothetical protein
VNDDKTLLLLLEGIELPETAYQGAKRRYDDLGEWFDRDDCTLSQNDPHIFVQGSFALGTAIRPAKEGQEYDLDLSCKLRTGVGRASHSQQQLKEMVGRELESYRKFRRIESRLEPKNRCWRLNYKDELRFHMDVVPATPVEAGQRASLRLLIEQHGADPNLAADIAADACWITDQRHPGFSQIQDNWLSSNPEGYVRWFVSRMEGTRTLLGKRAQVDDVPVYARKTPLQRIVQLLKAHRDVRFEMAPDCKPISIVLTTIAGEAHEPGSSLTDSMTAILQAFDEFRRSNSDTVPNPVNPAENFADRWKTPEGRQRQLKENFHRWIVQAGADFQYLMSQADSQELRKRAESSLKVRLDERAVAAALGVAAAPVISSPSPRHVTIQSPPKPWGSER